MKQTNKKYTSKEMAMMAALTTESMLLHENYDAMLYWNGSLRYYCIIVDYINDNPLGKYTNYSCSRFRVSETNEGENKEVGLLFDY